MVAAATTATAGDQDKGVVPDDNNNNNNNSNNSAAPPPPPSRARMGSFIERRLAPLASSSSSGLGAASASPMTSPVRQRRNTMRDALRRTVSNIKYGSLLETLKNRAAESAESSPADASAFKRSSFLVPGASSFRDEADGDKGGEEMMMPEGDVFVLGTVVGARLAANSDLRGWGKSLWCEWKVVNDDKWSLVRGASEGTTHMAVRADADTPRLVPLDETEDEDGVFVWQNPLNLQLRTRTSFDWPKLCFTVYQRCSLSSTDTLHGYSVVSLPLDTGYHRLRARCWRPTSRTNCMDNELSVYYTGIRPELSRKSLAWQREGPYMNLQMVAVGSIDLELNVVFSKEMEEIFGIELAEEDAGAGRGADAGLGLDPSSASLGDDGVALSEGLRIVRSRRGKRFNEVTSSLVAAQMLKKSVVTRPAKFDPLPAGSPFPPTSEGGQPSTSTTPLGPDSILSPADKARADRRQRMQALMEDRAQKRAERAQRKNLDT